MFKRRRSLDPLRFFLYYLRPKNGLHGIKMMFLWYWFRTLGIIAEDEAQKRG